MRGGASLLEARAAPRHAGRAQVLPPRDDRAVPRPCDGRARLVPPCGRAQSTFLAALGSSRAEARPVKRALVALAVLGALAVPAVAAAHPLGNFTTNHYSRVVASGDRVYVLYVLDLAEIPTFQEKPTAANLLPKIERGISLRVDGHAVSLRPLRHALAFPPGVAGLRTSRFESVYGSPRLRPGSHRLEYRDNTFPGRVGWKEVVVQHDSGARVDSTPRRRSRSATSCARTRRTSCPARWMFAPPASRSLPEPGRERRPRPRRARRSTPASPSTRAATAGSRASSPGRS